MSVFLSLEPYTGTEGHSGTEGHWDTMHALESLLRFKPSGRIAKICGLKVATLGHWVCSLQTK